jgi:4-amino-4-deoxy-L-arabinose transferase-like glycosyltransferase
VRARPLAALAGLLAVLSVGIFDHDLWAPDEPRAAELGREFLEPGRSWAVPTLNGRPFLEKPPLVYWTIAGCLRAFGVHDGVARLPCVFFGGGTLLFTWLLARRLYGGEAGGAACLILGTTWGFLVATHHVEADAGLLLFVTATAYFLWRAVSGGPGWYGAASLSALGAFFSKGFIGFAFPGLFLVTWIAWTRTPRELLRARPWIWIPLVALPVGAWLHSLGPELRSAFLVDNHLGRFLGAGGDLDRGHSRYPWYYLLQLPLWFLPWTLMILPAGRWVWSRRRERPERFLLSWILPAFLFLSVAGTKRAVYLVPLFPPLSILAAGWLGTTLRRRWLEPAVGALVLVLGIGWILVVPSIDRRRSFRPFCREMAARLGPRMKLYGYDTDETTQAVVPFYTGRTFVPLSTEAELSELAGRATGEVAVITVDVRQNPWHSNQVRSRFPHAWLVTTDDRGRRMQLFSNVPGP